MCSRQALRFAPRRLPTIFDPTPEHAQLRDLMRDFTKKEVEPQALEFNRNEQFNLPLYQKLGELGVLGVTADVEHGGAGMDATAACILMEELCRSDPAFGLSVLAHSMLFVNNLNLNGTEEQKARFLPDACSGAKIGGMCMSEPAVGTDVLAMTTSATKQDDGSWILNGQKMWITNGCVSDTELGDVFLVYAKTGERALSLFLVEKGAEGFSLGQRIKDKCGMRASATAELCFTNVRVPAENLVGKEGGAVWCMMRNLEIERVTLGAMALGIAGRCFDVMQEYSGDRRAFGQPLANFGQIQRYIGNSYAQLHAGRAYTYNVASSMQLAIASQRLATDGVKLMTTTMAKDVADNAIQVLGGYGYCGEYAVERLWRDAKLLEIGGGTLESHQKNITRDLAAKQ